MRKIIILLGLVFLAGCCARQPTDAVYQYSAISAFMQGGYAGTLKFADIRERGDFGLGTFDGIDGEMTALDGKFYQIRADGRVYPVEDSALSPFAQVKFFNPDLQLAIDQEMGLAELGRFLDTALGTRNLFFALRIEGEFAYVKTRSIDRQVKPYRPFLEVAKEQREFEFSNVRGVMVGFFSPAYLPRLTPPGYHFHFLTADRRSGGHLLDCRIKKGTVFIDRASEFDLGLPAGQEFLGLDLNQESGAYK